MKQSKKTALMTRLFSGDEAAKAEIMPAIAQCKENGTAETENFSLARLGDNIVVEDKANGEITKVDETPEKFELEAVKSYAETTDANAEDAAKTNEDKKDDQKAELITIAPEKLQEMVIGAVTEATKALSEKVEGIEKKYCDMEKMYSDAVAAAKPATEEKSEEDKLKERAVACGLPETATLEEVEAKEAESKGGEEGLKVEPTGEEKKEDEKSDEEKSEEERVFSAKATKTGENDFGAFLGTVLNK